jgi:hypothetical protein
MVEEKTARADEGLNEAQRGVDAEEKKETKVPAPSVP